MASVLSTPLSSGAKKEKSRTVFAKVFRNPLGWIGAIFIVLFAIIALFAPIIAPVGSDVANFGTTLGIPNRMTQVSYSPLPELPSAKHIFGVSADGYDIFFGLVWGARSAFLVSITIVAISLVLGLLVGIIAGYFGGRIDNILMRLTDIIFAFPALVLLIVLVVVFKGGIVTIIFASAIIGWGSYARVLRGEILKVKRLEYVDAARALGADDFRIIMKHVLPNSLTTLLVLVSLDIGTTVVSFAGLSFIGIGAPSGFPDWGQLINLAKPWLTELNEQGQLKYWFTWVYPGLAIVLYSLSWNMLGDAIRDATDPRAK
jgi:peptide/nickel transport system permease protein